MLKYIHNHILVDTDNVKKIDKVDGRTIILFNDDTSVLLDPFYGKDNTKIETLGLSNRAINALHNDYIYYIYQIPKSVNQLVRIPQMGLKTAEEICAKLEKSVKKCQQNLT